MRHISTRPCQQCVIDLALLSVLIEGGRTWPRLVDDMRRRLAPDLTPTGEVLASRLEAMAALRQVSLPASTDVIRLLSAGRELLQELASISLTRYRHEIAHLVESLKLACLPHLSADDRTDIMADILASRERCLAVQRARLARYGSADGIAVIAAHRLQLAEAETDRLQARYQTLQHVQDAGRTP